MKTTTPYVLIVGSANVDVSVLALTPSAAWYGMALTMRPHPSYSSFRIPRFQNAIHKGLALCQLLQRDKFVGPMSICDIARSTNDRGNPHLLEQPRLRTIGHFAHRRLSGQLHRPLHDCIGFGRGQARGLAGPDEIDSRLRVDRLHLA